MNLAVIGRSEVARLLTYEACIPLMREAMMALSAGHTQQTLRQIIDLGEGRAFGVMPGAMAEVFGAKLVSVYPGNGQQGGQSHQGLLALFDPASGEPVAVLHGGEVTTIRTAAASAAATSALARSDARRLAILGTGEQARAHALAMATVRDLDEVRIWGRSEAKVRQLIEELADLLFTPCHGYPTAAEAVREADIICTVTASQSPVLENAWVADGAHVNLVGSSRPGPREVDDALIVRGRVFADHREGVLQQGAEILHAKAAGLINDDHVLGAIGEVMAGIKFGRMTKSDLTVYKSIGSIVQDLVSGSYILGQVEAAKRVS